MRNSCTVIFITDSGSGGKQTLNVIDSNMDKYVTLK